VTLYKFRGKDKTKEKTAKKCGVAVKREAPKLFYWPFPYIDSTRWGLFFFFFALISHKIRII
jgi:hypothetical protein